jgi:hypothetical protein
LFSDHIAANCNRRGRTQLIPFRKWIILTHRYLGIVLSLLFILWFVSGIAMIYARGMPSLTPGERIKRLPELDISAVKISPSAAVTKAELGRPPFHAVLLMVMGRPAYRFASDGVVTVFADTGELLQGVGQQSAIEIAGIFTGLPASKLHYAGELQEPDQWTLEVRERLPMHKISADDDFRTNLYISEDTGEVEVMTTRASRVLAWIAAIPHWMYFLPLRMKDDLWRQVVLWTSGAGGILALLGIILAFTQFPNRYSGLMRWHYVTGTLFGIFTLTWVFSGWLSMEPFFWASGGGTGDRIPQALSGGPLDIDSFPTVDAPVWHRVLSGHSPKEVEFARIQNEPYFIATIGDTDPLLLSINPFGIRRERFSTESLLARIQKGNPEVSLAESELLSDYDSYYHPGDRRPPLPILRVKFGDPDATWFYVDPRLGQAVARFTRRERIQRWIYHGFHSLDFNFWYYNGTVWRATMVGLNAGGAFLSTIGLLLAIKRVKRSLN